jgi:thiosulfate/3-mercaptopyruvate sulfurtransferase
VAGYREKEVQMKPITIIFTVLTLILLGYSVAFASERGPSIVTTEWVAQHLKDPGIVIADIRKVDEYKEGHIPGSVNVTYNAWRTMEKGVSCQLPLDEDIEDTLRSAGICCERTVVIVGKTDTDLDRAHPARVAWTMKYAGIVNIAILDGGYTKWKTENRPVIGGWTKVPANRYCCNWNKDVLCLKECLKKKVGQAVIVDTRLPEYFYGKTEDPRAKRKGHIPGSVNLPSSLVFKADGLFQDRESLARHASLVVGEDKKSDVIVLCCTGRYSPVWWFVLSEALGYEKVSVYDGSMEEWCADSSAPVARD